MYYPERIKQAPMTGLAGFGGGASGLGTAGAAVLPFINGGDRGIWAGGTPTGYFYDIIGYADITSTCNASDFGDTAVACHGGRGCTNGTRAVYGGGWAASVHNVMQYVDMGTPGNASDFGDLTGNQHGPASCSGAPS